MKYLLLTPLLLVTAATYGQMTQVTAQVKDANGQLYVNCQWSVVFVNQNTTPGAGPSQPAALLVGQQGHCDSSGNLNVQLADNVITIQPKPSQWNFSICSAPGYVPGGTYCRSNMLVTVTGQTLNLTSFFQPLMPLLPVGGGGGGGNFITGATPNGGLVQTGTTLGMLTTCIQGQFLGWNGTAWACTGAGVGGGTTVTVNGTAPIPNVLNFNSAAPLPPAGNVNVVFQLNGTNVSGYVPSGGTTGTVNITAVRSVWTIATQNGEDVGGPLGVAANAATGVGGQNSQVIYPDYTAATFRPYFGEFHSFLGASTSTVVGVSCCTNGNNTVLPLLGFSDYIMRYQLVDIGAGTRYWWGLSNWNVGSGVGLNNVGIGGTTAYAADLPNKTTLGFRASGGVDTTFKAVEIQATTTGTPITTVLDTGVPIDTNLHTFEIRLANNSTQITWLIDGAVVGSAANIITPSIGTEFDLLAAMFWVGDNKNTATAVGATLYYYVMVLSQ